MYLSLLRKSIGTLCSCEILRVRRGLKQQLLELVAFINTALEGVILCLNWLSCMNRVKVTFTVWSRHFCSQTHLI